VFQHPCIASSQGDGYSASLKICDLTQFILSGKWRRENGTFHEKIAYISSCSPDDRHVLIIPGRKMR